MMHSLASNASAPSFTHQRTPKLPLSSKSVTRMQSDARLPQAAQQQQRGYAPEGLALDKVKKMRLLKKLGSTQQEVEQYLKLYSQVDSRRFGVFKVGGGVLLNEMDDLCSSISALVECGLIPVIVHGAGPQLNQALKEQGIVSNYVSGLRVTTPDILAVARKVFQRENLRLVCATLHCDTAC
jgi:acetylglutamate synthase